jgi:hypothetical protein
MVAEMLAKEPDSMKDILRGPTDWAPLVGLRRLPPQFFGFAALLQAS